MTKPSHFARQGAVMKIRHLESGLILERFPPDAREAVETGGYEFVESGTPSIREVLTGLPEEELNPLAHQVKIRLHNEERTDIVARLVPFVESGEVQLP